ncbi:DUF86 domain-containing protein [Fibrella sp. USSR17]
MFSSKNLTYICTILEHIKKITIYTKGFSEADGFAWANDQLNYNATWSLLLVIGEETKEIDKALKAPHVIIPRRQMGGIREFLVHDYRGVDDELVFIPASVNSCPLNPFSYSC